jgi:hypothetical protein
MYVQRVARVRLCSGITLLGGVSQWNLTLALLPQAKVVRFCHPRCKFCDHVAALVLHCISSQDATVSGSSPDGTAFGSTTVLQVQQLSSSPLCQSPVQRPRRSGTMADVHANVLPCAERLGLSSSAEGSEVAIPFPSVGLIYSVSFSRNGSVFLRFWARNLSKGRSQAVVCRRFTRFVGRGFLRKAFALFMPLQYATCVCCCCPRGPSISVSQT